MNDIEFFKQNGYLVLSDALPKGDLDAFRKTFIKIVSRVIKTASKKHPELLPIEKYESYNEALIKLQKVNCYYVSVIQRLISRTPEFYKLSSSDKLFTKIKELFLKEKDLPIYILSNGIVLTNPNNSTNKRSSNFELDWHKDTFFTIPKSHFIQFWGPVLHNATEEIGALMLCPGSHKDGFGKQIFHPEKHFNHRYSIEKNEVKQYKKISVPLQLGQMLIFDGRLIHASGKNTDNNKIRASIIGVCHDATQDECIPVSTNYLYYEQTPESWFYEIYNDEKAKEIMFEQAATFIDPKGGV